MADLKPYPAYKPSGIPWLGDVPAHWTLRRMKTVLADRSEKGFPDEPLLAATQTKGVVRKENYESRTVLALKDLHLLKLVRVGDFVISLRSFQGGIEYAREQGIISPAYTVLFPLQRENHAFLSWLFKSKPFIENLTLYVTGIRQGQNIDYEKLSRSRVPLPLPNEQHAIARYLDHIDRRIRRYIRAKQKLISLLNEQKQAIIQQAVTRGLDPAVRLKPSGVEWLGDVPEHWNSHPAKHFYREVDNRSKVGTEELLSVSHLTGVTPRSQKNVTMFMASTYVGHKICEPDDLVINTMWAWMGALGVTGHTGIVSPSYAVYRPRNNSTLLGEYADILLRTKPYIDEYVCRSTGIRSSRLRLYPEQFLRIFIICPPVREQLSILEHVAIATDGLKASIDRAQREISLLKEYRTRLIADVVTGKVDVRAAAAALPEEDAGREEDEPGEGEELEEDEAGDPDSVDAQEEA